MTSADIWTTNKFIKEPAGDGGCPRIPTLQTRNNAGNEMHINENGDKAKLFAKTFFPLPPPLPANILTFEYPEPLPDPPQITKDQI